MGLLHGLGTFTRRHMFKLIRRRFQPRFAELEPHIGGVAGGYIGDRMDRQAEKIEEELPGAEVTRVGEGINVTFNEDAGVHFDTAKSSVKGTSAETLNKLAGIFKEYPKSVILIEGHTDSVGSDERNQDLSEARAAAVRSYLMSKGVNPNRLNTIGHGEGSPIDTNDTNEGKTNNRRVEIIEVK